MSSAAFRNINVVIVMPVDVKFTLLHILINFNGTLKGYLHSSRLPLVGKVFLLHPKPVGILVK